MASTLLPCELLVTVHGPATWDLEGNVLSALEEAGLATTVERLRRPTEGLEISYSVSADAPPEIAVKLVADAVSAVPTVTDVLITERHPRT